MMQTTPPSAEQAIARYQEIRHRLPEARFPGQEQKEKP